MKLQTRFYQGGKLVFFHCNLFFIQEEVPGPGPGRAADQAEAGVGGGLPADQTGAGPQPVLCQPASQLQAGPARLERVGGAAAGQAAAHQPD